jgi:NAD(P)-dependent dehydrogenase (short-subunit alcohol dehydrogenase family)
LPFESVFQNAGFATASRVMEMEKRVILVVGARGGIGSALARILAFEDVHVVLAGRSREGAAALTQEVSGQFEELDAADFAQTQAVVERIVAQHGRIDGAVNLAGSIVLKAAHATSQEEWTATLQTNLTTAFSVVRAAAPAIGSHGGGSVVLMSSAAARIGLMQHDAIAAAKAGVIGLTLSAAATYAGRGVRVNAVAPGLVATSLAARITGNEASLKASTAMHPLGRIGDPGDVASAIAWLLHPAQKWVTGQVLGVDGGLGSVRSR